jgi:hypothetical protein
MGGEALLLMANPTTSSRNSTVAIFFNAPAITIDFRPSLAQVPLQPPWQGRLLGSSEPLLANSESRKPEPSWNEMLEETVSASAWNRYASRAMWALWNDYDRLALPLGTDPWSPADELAFTAAVTVSVGYVALNIRSLYLLASVFLSKPLWRQFDVEAVLDSWEEDDKQALPGHEDEDDEQELSPLLG